MALAKLYLLIANIQVCRSNWNFVGTTGMFSETSLFTWFAAVTCCCNHLTNFKFSGSNWKSNCTTGTFSKIYLCNRFSVVTCCCNHLTNFNFSGSNWKSNCTPGTFSKIYLCNRFAAVTCCSNQVTDYSTFQDPRETPMRQQVPFAKLVCLTALLLQLVRMMLINTFQHLIETL